MQQVVVRIPASTSNLGPGFDCLGVALRLYNEVHVQRGGRREMPPMMGEAADLFFDRAALRPFRFHCRASGDVPIARGLGSSVTVRLGLLHGLNELAERPLRRQEIFELCVSLEGHPDNAAPAEWGGFSISRGLQRQRFSVPAALKFILLIPDFEVSTSAARSLLPTQIPRHEAVETCANVASMAAAFASGDFEKLRGAFVDHLHQPYRKHLVPHFDAALAAAEAAGALGGFLSGSGSTIAAVTLHHAEQVGAAMLQAAPLGARVLITTADNRGAQIMRS
ncbi:MAG: homoserine kinase [Chthoniobacterales bacterium]|nr:homoserine kinase [Chthoniobacterales bacterium]